MNEEKPKSECPLFEKKERAQSMNIHKEIGRRRIKKT